MWHTAKLENPLSSTEEALWSTSTGSTATDTTADADFSLGCHSHGFRSIGLQSPNAAVDGPLRYDQPRPV
jgi:hypothetical protein